uniref:CYTH domain-containing protein n=1 Tax=Acrobeloides nanus TaxID=290746 RepID=A0A914C3B3_9BILA
METVVFNFTEQIGQITHEEDVYFDVPQGQLKLRYTRPNRQHAELIAYEQTNEFGPNICEYRTSRINDPEIFHKTLSMTLPELGVIRRKRRTYAKDHVVINLDEMENLGLFIDIIIAADGSNDTKQIELVNKLKKDFGIDDCNLVSLSYLDLLRKHKSFDSGLDDESDLFE